MIRRQRQLIMSKMESRRMCDSTRLITSIVPSGFRSFIHSSIMAEQVEVHPKESSQAEIVSSWLDDWIQNHDLCQTQAPSNYHPESSMYSVEISTFSSKPAAS